MKKIIFAIIRISYIPAYIYVLTIISKPNIPFLNAVFAIHLCIGFVCMTEALLYRIK